MILDLRKKPVVVQACQWTGDNEQELIEFTGGQFNALALTETDRANLDDPEMDAEVRDSQHNTWVLLKTGDWIIRGVRAEFYPCTDEILRETYEANA